jgi:hypothetical protein
MNKNGQKWRFWPIFFNNFSRFNEYNRQELFFLKKIKGKGTGKLYLVMSIALYIRIRRTLKKAHSGKEA